jgi:uncharacterized protein YdeI (YjbR/CyaY-like superfamily)
LPDGAEPKFFRSEAEFRGWLERHHGTARELWVGFHKKSSGRGGLEYKAAVDEALCFGWIDGLKKRLDAASYMHRFSPRTATSIWSTVNLKRMKELIAGGRVARPGLAAYEQRDARRSGLYSFENRPQTLDVALEKRCRADARAWRFFRAQPPGYQKVCVWFVMSAKKAETRLRRVDPVIARASQEKRLKWM